MLFNAILKVYDETKLENAILKWNIQMNIFTYFFNAFVDDS